MPQAISLTLHVLATVIWIGGMFFAHLVLRPVTVKQLEAPARLTLWNAVFARFFPWVWSAILLLLVTGYYLLFAGFGGMKEAPVYVHIMNGLGLLMMALFLLLFFIPYRRLHAAVKAQQWIVAGRQLNLIRYIVATNLTLGLITVAVATGGSYF